ncbi:MAG: energy-coupling factor transporter transmembrane component T family protein [Candidatus Asgardarchaeia archaeon]
MHRLDPRTKLIMLLLHTASVLLIWDLRVLPFFFVVGMSWLFLSRINIREIRKPFFGIMSVIIVMVLLTDLFFPAIAVEEPHIIFSWGPIAISYEAIVYSITVAVRYLSIFPVAAVFILTTDPSKLTVSFSKLKVPYKIAFAINIALRYLPTLLEDYSMVLRAQMARGLEIEGKKAGFISRLKKMVPIMVPMLLMSISRAEQIADAMDLRGFGAYKKRTWYYDTKMSGEDYIALLLYSLLLISSIAMRMFVFKGIWIPPYGG